MSEPLHTLTPLPCPFCGAIPTVGPRDPAKEGNAFGFVVCLNVRCPAKPTVSDGIPLADGRGPGAYMDAAIRRWNARQEPDHPEPSRAERVAELRGLTNRNVIRPLAQILHGVLDLLESDRAELLAEVAVLRGIIHSAAERVAELRDRTIRMSLSLQASGASPDSALMVFSDVLRGVLDLLAEDDGRPAPLVSPAVGKGEPPLPPMSWEDRYAIKAATSLRMNECPHGLPFHVASRFPVEPWGDAATCRPLCDSCVMEAVRRAVRQAVADAARGTPTPPDPGAGG